MTAAGVISLAVGCAAVTEDLLYRRISNWTAGAGFLGGILLHAWQGGWRGGLWALAGAAVGFIVFLVFFLAKGMGGGDVKLMAAFGSLVGPGATLSAAWAAALVGGLMALTFAAVVRSVGAQPLRRFLTRPPSCRASGWPSLSWGE